MPAKHRRRRNVAGMARSYGNSGAGAGHAREKHEITRQVRKDQAGLKQYAAILLPSRSRK